MQGLPVSLQSRYNYDSLSRDLRTDLANTCWRGETLKTSKSSSADVETQAFLQSLALVFIMGSPDCPAP